MDLSLLLLACAPLIAPDTAQALIAVESGGNPYAIGVVAGSLVRQPRNLAEAVATVRVLDAEGWNYSVGLAQINKSHFQRFGLTAQAAFEPCGNLRAMQDILGDCFGRAAQRASTQTALRQAFSCYYSGNFQTGFQHGYVNKVVAAWSQRAPRRTTAAKGGLTPPT
jgi:type IV secretion system protein VirB1